jgi:hypothetical protein
MALLRRFIGSGVMTAGLLFLRSFDCRPTLFESSNDGRFTGSRKFSFPFCRFQCRRLRSLSELGVSRTLSHCHLFSDGGAALLSGSCSRSRGGWFAVIAAVQHASQFVNLRVDVDFLGPETCDSSEDHFGGEFLRHVLIFDISKRVCQAVLCPLNQVATVHMMHAGAFIVS